MDPRVPGRTLQVVPTSVGGPFHECFGGYRALKGYVRPYQGNYGHDLREDPMTRVIGVALSEALLPRP